MRRNSEGAVVQPKAWLTSCGEFASEEGASQGRENVCRGVNVLSRVVKGKVETIFLAESSKHRISFLERASIC